MTNLSVTTACNRACKYCFAQVVMSEGRRGSAPHMPEEVFLRALDFLRRSRIDQVRLLGGEPTLHPGFTGLIDLALKQGFRVLVFSNGQMPEPVLRKLEAAPEGRVAVLINVSAAEGDGPAGLPQPPPCLERLGERVILGMNIHRPGLGMGFLLHWIEQFGLARSVRLGLAHPCLEGANASLHPRHYEEVGRRVAALAASAARSGVRLEFDCGFVPCMFPDEFFRAIGRNVRDVGCRCNPILDVLPDGSVVSCYALAGLGREALPHDRDAAWLRRRFASRLAPYRALGVFRRCGTCPLREAGDCQAGCLAAAMQRLRGEALATAQAAGASPSEGPRFEPRPSAVPSEHREEGTSREAKRAERWIIPYIDQPMEFWERLLDEFGERLGEVYFPLPGDLIGSGRPVQPSEHLDEFLGRGSPARSVLISAITLPRPVDEIAPAIIGSLRRLMDEAGVRRATVGNLLLAARIRDALPDLRLTASVLMDVARPIQAIMLQGICDALVPASRIVRDLASLEALRAAFPGRIRLIVNEACLPGCPFRSQHFLEMADPRVHPHSLCDELLRREPWLRLTGAWVLPQHLHLYAGLYDELKLAGRVTLRDPARYRRVLAAYVHRRPLSPDAIGGGPASVAEPIEIREDFFARTLRCGHRCQECRLCRDYYEAACPTSTQCWSNSRGSVRSDCTACHSPEQQIHDFRYEQALETIRHWRARP